MTREVAALFGLAIAGCPDSAPVAATATNTTPTGATAEPTTTGAAPTTTSGSTMAVSITDAATSTTGTASTTSTTSTTTDPDTTTSSTGHPGTDSSTSGGMMDCADTPPTPAGPEVELAPAFIDFYKTYALGAVPGIPEGSRLGGCVIAADDPNLLLVAGDSEAATGKIWAIEVVRGNCQHIVGFKGVAQPIADTPYVDANLVLVASGLMFYTGWPVNQISQLLPGEAAPAVTTDMAGLGVESAVSGLGFVPPGYVDAGGMRTITWPGGKWYHLDREPSGDTFALTAAQQTAELINGPGGFAYIPSGSPGFMVDHLIVSEWSVDTVGVYEVDASGDPVAPTRKDFFTKFPGPWGAYFEPLTGDFLFLTWGLGIDKVYIVQGFEPPPPIPQ